MADNATRTGTGRDQTRGFHIKMMFHPSHHVTDLRGAESWFARVFGVPSTPIETLLSGAARPGYPTDYSTFTFIRDVLMDSVDPKRYVINGKQMYKSIDGPHLKNLGWYVEGLPEVYRAFRRNGFGVHNQLEELVETDDAPTSMFFSVAEETGIRYQFFETTTFPLDPRTEPGWELAPVSETDPLGIERCSHHTILTDQPERALELVVGVLGGEVIHQGRDLPRGTTSTYVDIGASTLEYAVPDEGTAAHEDWATDAPRDTYHAITWKVADLDRARRHLEAQGVGIRFRSDDTIITDPATSLGIAWGFTSASTPGDPRSAD